MSMVFLVPVASGAKHRADLCPKPTAIAPRDIAVQSITTPDNEPREGTYLFQSGGSPGFRDPIGVNIIRDLEEQADPLGGPGFSYTFDDLYSGITIHLASRDETDETEISQFDGLYLTEIDIRMDRDQHPLTFIPNPPLALFAYPIFQPDEMTSSGIDVSAKREGPAGVGPPSANAMSSHTMAGPRETIAVCADLMQVVRTSWDLRITGEYNFRLLGTFSLATQYGGWPARADFFLTGDRSGEYTSSLMRVDPGVYI